MFERRRSRKPIRRGGSMLRHHPTRLLSALLVVLLPGVAAARPEPVPAGLTGLLLDRAERAPLAGAKLLAADSATGRVFPSAPTESDGRFSVPDLPPGTYELAVQAHDGLYLVEPAVRLGPGAVRSLSIAVGAEQGTGEEDAAGSKLPRPSVWNRPFTAALIVLGSAIVVGLIVDQATDDDDTEDPASPF
jgi:hypothetical protein